MVRLLAKTVKGPAWVLTILLLAGGANEVPEDWKSNPKDHPLFWAVDINNELTENATICSFFDILMEG